MKKEKKDLSFIILLNSLNKVIIKSIITIDGDHSTVNSTVPQLGKALKCVEKCLKSHCVEHIVCKWIHVPSRVMSLTTSSRLTTNTIKSTIHIYSNQVFGHKLWFLCWCCFHI